MFEILLAGIILVAGWLLVKLILYLDDLNLRSQQGKLKKDLER